MAVRENMQASNFGTAARYAEFAIKYAKLSDGDRAKLEAQFASCRERGLSNASGGDYTCPTCHAVGSAADTRCAGCQTQVLLCAETLEPILSAALYKCTFCEGTFSTGVRSCPLCTFGSAEESPR
eukprot:TRINITY_DN2680_c0_g1_i2.p3 TRINITY_DN2680_c0_g1~~TRINITY_DN2680_c0_g1_i2.p3  ORF type:complete len:125 (+),score=48.29 TRINITY_DN2680_c0_g1_i2:285-659(+)